jgi:hypothetical protein
MTTSRNDSHSITPLASLRPIAKLVFGRALPAHGAFANPSRELRERMHLKNLIKLLDQAFDCRDGVPAADGGDLFT